jgi:hypothetical protein
MGRELHSRSRAHSTGLLRRFIRWMRGTNQVLVRPTADIPLVLISYEKADLEGAEHLRESLEETWFTLPVAFQSRYVPILEKAPPLVVVQLRRRGICTCLGHHHPPGTESRFTRRLRHFSGVRTAEIDLAYEAIRDWEPMPLSHLALPEIASGEETVSHQWQLALLSVFLHELHHLVEPSESEQVVRSHSQRFYVDALSQFLSQHFGVEYGLRRDMASD